MCECVCVRVRVRVSVSVGGKRRCSLVTMAIGFIWGITVIRAYWGQLGCYEGVSIITIITNNV